MSFWYEQRGANAMPMYGAAGARVMPRGGLVNPGRYGNGAGVRGNDGARTSERVLPRSTSSSTTSAASSFHIVVSIAVAMLIVASLLCLRIGIDAHTVTLAKAAQTAETQLKNARSESSILEVQQSSLSNSTRIKAEATTLGLVVPEETETLVMPKDSVAISADGSLDLRTSVYNVAENQGALTSEPLVG